MSFFNYFDFFCFFSTRLPKTVPYIYVEIEKQTDLKDCGLSVLQSFVKHFHNKEININEFKEQVDFGTDGISIANLISLGNKFGLISKAYNTDLNSLIMSKPQSEIIALIKINDQNHFVIISKISRNVTYLDPMVGKVRVSLKEFEKRFLNMIIHVEKGVFSYERFTIKSFSKYISNAKFIYPWIIITILASTIFSIGSTWFIKLILDSIIPNHMSNFLVVLFLAFIWIAVLRTLNTLFKNYLIKKINLSISIKIYHKFFYKMQHGSIQDINKLTRSDKLRRLSMIENVSTYFSHVLFAIFSEALYLIISIGILSWINLQLFIITAIGGALIVCITATHQHLIYSKYQNMINKQLDFTTCNMDLLMIADEIKDVDLANMLASKQINKLDNFKMAGFKIWKVSTSQNTFLTMVMMLLPILIIFLATRQILLMQMSIGSMLLFLSLFQQFTAPLSTFTNIFIEYPLIKKELLMLNYILNLKNENLNQGGVDVKEIKQIEFKEYSFGYESNKPIVKLKHLMIDSNIKLIGKNGSGKSSILNVLSSRYFGKGTLKINNIDINRISLSSYRNLLFYSSSNNFLPSIRIIEYITDNDAEKYATFERNLHKYGIDNYLNDLKLDLSAIIYNNGINLSSGQRQSIKILKLFTKKYQLILLDESFENIDPKKQKWLIEAILDFQKNAIFVEVSHNKKIIPQAKEVNIEKINQN